MVDYQTYGLVGEKISKALSPQIYNAAFAQMNISAVYMPFPVSKDRILTALPVLRAEFSGFNVTSPFRLELTPHLDRLDESVKRAGSANTVVVKDGKLIGYNTDMVGFERSLIGFMRNVYDNDVLVVGAGGVAHSIATVLLEKGAFVTILSRNIAHAMTMKNHLQNRYNKNRVKVIKGISESDSFFAIVNAAAVDLESKQSEVTIHNQTYQSIEYAYDVSYRPTAFLTKAKDFGVKTKSGFDMLFYQSVGALDVWLDKDVRLGVETITKLHNDMKQSTEW